jgi:hypothetical protein
MRRRATTMLAVPTLGVRRSAGVILASLRIPNDNLLIVPNRELKLQRRHGSGQFCAQIALLISSILTQGRRDITQFGLVAAPHVYAF